MTPKCDPQHFWDRFDNYNYFSNAHYDAIKLKIYSSRHDFCAFGITLSVLVIKKANNIVKIGEYTTTNTVPECEYNQCKVTSGQKEQTQDQTQPGNSNEAVSGQPETQRQPEPQRQVKPRSVTKPAPQRSTRPTRNSANKVNKDFVYYK